MNYRYEKIIFLVVLIFISLVTIAYAVVPPVPNRPLHHVVDLANIIENSTELRLDGYLKELEQKTTAQVVILTVLSLEGESLEDFSLSTAYDKWKLGQRDKDNGVLIVIVLKDRKYRFEIGYGLEGLLPDSLVGSIGRTYFIPYFQKGDYTKGIYLGTLAVIDKIASSEGVEISGMPTLNKEINSEGYQKDSNILRTVFALLFFLGAMILFIKNPRLFLFLLLMSSLGGGRRGGWSSRGGFGGSGGFSGGGGGFGGGGASGGW